MSEEASTESAETLVTAFVHSDGNYQIVTDGPDAKCPECGWPERHRVFSEPDNPASKIADGCPSCETSRIVTLCRDCSEGKHGACIGSAFVENGPEIDEIACRCPDATHTDGSGT